jgi:acyl carrier protein
MVTKIKEILSEITNNPELKSLPDNAGILTDAALDSLQIISFVLQVEQELKVEFDFDNFEYDNLSTIRNFCDFILTLQAGKK